MQEHKKSRKLTNQLTPLKKCTTREKVSRQHSQTDNSGQGKLLKSQTRPTRYHKASNRNRKTLNPSAS